MSLDMIYVFASALCDMVPEAGEFEIDWEGFDVVFGNLLLGRVHWAGERGKGGKGGKKKRRKQEQVEVRGGNGRRGLNALISFRLGISVDPEFADQR